MTPRALKILVADDHDFTREFMEAMLEERGHRVTLCRDGQEAVERLIERAERFDLVLMDAQMPRLDGLDATRQLRAHPPTARLPIVCVSAKASGRTREEGLAAGCDRFVTKPCWEEDLMAVLVEVLRERGVLEADDEL